jgi:hypothetical protein
MAKLVIEWGIGTANIYPEKGDKKFTLYYVHYY